MASGFELPAGRPSGPRRRLSTTIAASLVAVAMTGVFLAASRPGPTPVVIVEDVPEVSSVLPTVRATGAVSAFAPTGIDDESDQAEQPECEGDQPGPSWNCHEGQWQTLPPAQPTASGGGRSDRAAGCLTEQPGPLFVCQEGLWMIAGATPAGAPQIEAPAGNDLAECPVPIPAPGENWSCEDGRWVRADEGPAAPPSPPDPSPPVEPGSVQVAGG